jgi:hypothetical protein
MTIRFRVVLDFEWDSRLYLDERLKELADYRKIHRHAMFLPLQRKQLNLGSGSELKGANTSCT